MSDYLNELGQPVGAPLSVKLPRPNPPHTPMQGQFCSVVSTDIKTHAKGLFKAFREDKINSIWTYLPYGPFQTLQAFTDWMGATCCDDDPFFHTILNATGQPVGLASFLRIKPNLGTIEVGHINFAPTLQRTAAATEAMFLMMQRAFTELGYRRYEWKCDALNAGSQRAAKRLGFDYEGVFRQATHYKGRNRDTAWYAIIDQDWPKIQLAYKSWLDLKNFDSEGNQRKPLSSFMKK